MKNLVLGTKETQKALDALMKQLKSQTPPADESFMVLPSSVRGGIDRDKYKGRGRPKADDYIRIPYPQYLGEQASSILGKKQKVIHRKMSIASRKDV